MSRVWTLIALLAVAASFALWWLGDPEPPAEPTPEVADDQADYWIESGRLERFNAEGRRQLELEADRMAHFPGDGRIELEQVWLLYHGREDLDWDIVSNRGEISGDRDRILLEGAVRMLRLPVTGEIMHFTTDWLELLTDEDLARTDAPVTMRQPGGHMTGTGLLVLLQRDHMTIQRDVRGFYGTDD